MSPYDHYCDDSFSDDQDDFFGGRGTWKTLAYPMPPGSGPEGETCATCAHYRSIKYHDKTYRKCGLMKASRSEATDILASSPACQKWEER